MFASAPHGSAASNRRAALSTISAAASVRAWHSASGKGTPWFCPMGRSNTVRDVA